MIRTIFLDAAGTLIEPAEPVAAVYVRHFASAGWVVEERSVKAAFRTVFCNLPQPDYAALPDGDGDAAERTWWRGVVEGTARECGISPEQEEMDRVFGALFAFYDRGEAWRVFSEVPAVLDRLRQRGQQIVVVSNFDRRLHRILGDLGLAPLFEAIVTSADARARKPDPAIFQQALSVASASSKETVHIGDHPVADGEGAAALQIASFVLDRPRTTLQDALNWLEGKI